MKILQSKPIFTVDELGNVYLTKSGRKLKPWVDKDGYLRCNTSFNGKNCHIAPHRAVAEAYVENHKPEEYNIVNHKDSNRQNNVPENLEWANARINTNHAHLNNRFQNIKGIHHSQTKMTLDDVHSVCKLLSLGMGTKAISDETGQSAHRVYSIKKGLCWRDIAESYGLKLPPKKEKVGIKYLIEEKKSLGITYEEMVADYLGDKKV